MSSAILSQSVLNSKSTVLEILASDRMECIRTRMWFTQLLPLVALPREAQFKAWTYFLEYYMIVQYI